jgi:hypothetical protein
MRFPRLAGIDFVVILIAANLIHVHYYAEHVNGQLGPRFAVEEHVSTGVIGYP